MGAYGVGEVLRLDLVGVVADITLGPGNVAPSSDQSRQIFALLDPPSVGGRPTVTDQQGTGVTIGDCLRLGLLLADRATVIQAQMTVSVDEARHDPPLGHELCTGLRLIGDQAIDHVEISRLPGRQGRAVESQRRHDQLSL